MCLPRCVVLAPLNQFFLLARGVSVHASAAKEADPSCMEAMAWLQRPPKIPQHSQKRQVMSTNFGTMCMGLGLAEEGSNCSFDQ